MFIEYIVKNHWFSLYDFLSLHGIDLSIDNKNAIKQVKNIQKGYPELFYKIENNYKEFYQS